MYAHNNKETLQYEQLNLCKIADDLKHVNCKAVSLSQHDRNRNFKKLGFYSNILFNNTCIYILWERRYVAMNTRLDILRIVNILVNSSRS